MTIKDDKLKDLTPLDVFFAKGESPTAEKLEGMMSQVQQGLEYIENTIGDVFGEEEKFNTWLTNFARDLGDRGLINPAVLPSHLISNYEQSLVLGQTDHLLDMLPIGTGAAMISASSDTAVVPSQFKQTVEELLVPGDWTIKSGALEDGKQKNSRILRTHSPSNGGSIFFVEVTSGRGSAYEQSRENVIPTIAQAEAGGPFCDIQVLDPTENTYLVTLPTREYMYDSVGNTVDFSASNTATAVGKGSQYKLPSFFFGASNLALEEDESGQPKRIPLNLVRLYDWTTKKRVEGVLELSASPFAVSKEYQLVLKMRQDVILATPGAYLITTTGLSFTELLASLVEQVYLEKNDGTSMRIPVSHKDLMGLRKSSVDFADRSKYYGPSNIDSNDHPMYFHRDGFTDTDKGAGGNVIRGDVVIGSTELGVSDSEHEHYNLTEDSFSLSFGHTTNAAKLKFDKIISHTIDQARGNVPQVFTDNALVIRGSISDNDGTTPNTILEGDLRITGDTVIGTNDTDTLFVQGQGYINKGLTFLPRAKATASNEEGNVIYDPAEKGLLVHNGSSYVNPAEGGYAAVIGDGINTFGKFNGTDITPFNNAIAQAVAKGGGVIKVLAGTYNIGASTISLPTNVVLEGEGHATSIVGIDIAVTFGIGVTGAAVKNMKIEGTNVGVWFNQCISCMLHNVLIENSLKGIEIGESVQTTLLSGMLYSNCQDDVSTNIPNANPPKEQLYKNTHTTGPWNFMDHNRKKEMVNKWKVVSGNIQVNYVDSSLSAQGRGHFEISGIGEIEWDEFMPVYSHGGVSGHIAMTRTGSATATVGFNAYDGNYNPTTTNGGFLLNSESPSSSSELSNSSSFFIDSCYGQGSAANQFNASTKFVKPSIKIAINTGLVRFDAFDMFPMSHARVAAYI